MIMITEDTRHRGALASLLALSVALGACGAMGDDSSKVSMGPADPPTFTTNPGGTNINLGGSQDTGLMRSELDRGLVPTPESLDAAGFFAEHHTALPPPSCGARICIQPQLAVMGNLMNGANCTLLHLGLNSPLAADPGSRPPLSLAVVVDTSGSMRGEPIDFVRDGLELLIDGMRDGDELALVRYSDTAEVLFPMAPVEQNRVELRSIVQSLVADGGTNLNDGLQAGYTEVQNGYDSARQNRVILLSDGQPTVGITGTEAIVSNSRAYNSDGIGLSTIGLGSSFNVELMRNLALQADGNFYFLENAGAVDEVFTEELSFFVVPVAFDLELSVTAGADYAFGRSLGSPFWTDTAEGGRLDVPSVFLAHREAHDDVTDSGGRRGGGSTLMLELMPQTSSGDSAVVADVELSFREPGASELSHDSVRVEYPFPATELRERGYFDGDVAVAQKSFVMLNIFVGMQAAVFAFHSNQANSLTIAELDSLIAAVDDYNEEIGDVDIELDLEMLRSLRVNLVASGVPDPSAPPPRDPWPAD